jgi:putative ABC transport system permease protein
MGASRGNTLSMLARQGLLLVAAGLAAGLAGGLGVGRLVSSLLYGIGSFDPITFIVVPLMLICVAGFAILLPAHRATKIDPLVALRYE